MAYLLYTSGSTGRPKGVANGHRGIVNRLLWGQARFPLAAGDRVLQKTPVSFDVSVWELLWPLTAGAQLVLARPGGHRDAAYLADVIARERITTTHFVASMLAVFLQGEGVDGSSLRRVLASGEALSHELEQQALERLAVPLYNLYGPTEAAIEVTWWACRPASEPRSVPIGRPVAATRIGVVEPGFTPAPVGVPGELVIGGVQLARGYHRRPARTAASFVPDPFGREVGGRLYRSGDLARFLPGGEVEFLGRIDHQVKLRGVRLELGEVEAALAAAPGVAEAVAAVRGDGPEARLVAYLVSAGEGISTAAVEASLRRRLPEAMVPGAYFLLQELPRTASGKVDRRALPEPALPRADGSREAPRTPVEELVAAAFQEVLGGGEPGREGDFFRLGGHSLLAAQVAARLRRSLGVEVSLPLLFEAPTVAALARRLEEALRQGPPAPPAIEPVPRDRPLPLSPAQQRLWLVHQMAPAEAAYNVPAAVELAGPLSQRELAAALAGIVQRHETLRTTFPAPGGRPVQQIAPAETLRRSWELPVVDLTALLPARRRSAAASLAAAEAGGPFDLERGPVLRTRLLRLGPEEHLLTVVMHHVVADGWSLGIFLRELAAGYRRPAGVAPATLPIQYADFAFWQRRWLKREAVEALLAYWRRQLDGVPRVLELPADRPRPPMRRGRGGRRAFHLDAGETAAVAALARQAEATPFMALLAGFGALLGRYTGRRDLLVGTPSAARDRLEVEELIGFFANTLVLRCELAGDPPFTRLLSRARETVLAAHAHQELPFERLVEELAPERDPAHTPLVQVVLALQTAPLEEVELTGLDVCPLTLPARTAKFDLTLALRPSGEGLEGVVEYDADLFDAATMARFTGHFRTLLAGVCRRPGERLSRLPLLTAPEAHQLAVAWNDTATPYPGGATVDELFTGQATQRPEAMAVVAEPSGEELAEHWSYGAVERRSRLLAHRLRRSGVGPESRVGVAMDRRPDLPMVLTAVLRAGGAYVPLDLSYPAERLTFMAADAGLEALVVTGAGPEGEPFDQLPSLAVEEAVAAAASPAALPPAAGGPDRLAYLTYTSGSTGRPKGVAVPHRGVVRLVRETGYARFGPDRVFLQLAAVAFDASTLEIWGALANGAKVVVMPPGVPSLPALGGALTRHRVTTAFLTTRLFDLVADERPADLSALEDLLVGGELASPAHFTRALGGSGPQALVNVYGPTESTTFTTWYRLPRGFDADAVPIGRSIANTRVHLLDRFLAPVPIGVPGELLIGGAGLARGYHARPALTAERFVPDPAGGGRGDRLYRTGDRARLLPAGELDFLGRLDDQVKLRGFRVELGEVESVLASHPDVRMAAVAVRADERGERRLVAYTVTVEPAPGIGELASFLTARLPEHMLPAAYVVLDALPLTVHGKVDRQALPEPERRTATEAEARPPVTPIEEILAGLWRELLGLEEVGTGESFFDLGGHSLLATQLVSRVRESFGVELPLADFFARPTVAEVARMLAAERAAATGATPPPLAAVERGEQAPLSFAQERLWFLDQLQPGNPAYNVPLAFLARGELSHQAIAGAFGGLVERHESLRTTFVEVAEEPVQVVAPPPRGPHPVPLVDLTALPGASRGLLARRLAAATAERPFDLSRGPLLWTVLCRLGDGEALLLVDLHHIVTDGWSMGVLLAEVAALYAARLSGGVPALAPLPLQYADFALCQRSWLEDGHLDPQLAYWRRRLTGADEPLELPTDRPRPAIQGLRGAAWTFTLERPLVAEVEAFCRREGVTPFMLLLAVFDLLLLRYTGRRELAVGSPIAGRNRQELEGLIGFFVNTLVLRVEAAPEGSFRRLLARVREAALDAYAHQDFPFERLVEELQPERRLSHQPLFQVMFALQNAPLGRLELPGVALERVEIERRTAKSDLGLTLEERGEGLFGELAYSSDLFDATTARRMAAHWRRLLAAALTAPDAALGELALLSAAEAQQLCREWNDTRRAVPPDLLLPQLLAEVVARQPEAVALVVDRAGEVEQVTYGELDGRATRLAHHLRRSGVGADVRVGLAMERTAGMVTAQLAVLKAGGAYVPLDPAYPAERLAFMAANAELGVCLVDGEGATSGSSPGTPVLDAQTLTCPVLDVRRPELQTETPRPFSAPIFPQSLAYVIYTSGSTGRPKGVGISHRALMRLIHHPPPAHQAWASTCTWTGAVSFDVSVAEVWCTLAAGARLVIPTVFAAALDELGRALERHQVRSAFFTTGLFQLVVDEAPAALASIRRLETGGDVASPAHFRKVMEHWPRTDLIHDYGPSENTVYTTFFRLHPAAELTQQVPIGRPLINSVAHVMDRSLRPVPAGLAGELCVGGAGLARGYLGRPGLTAAVFVPQPLAAEPGERLYRTGDLVRLGPDSNLEFIGRLDHQVKIRGYRIELGEIEAVLARHPRVGGALVLAQEDVPGEKRLVGYVMPDEPSTVAGEDLVAELAAYLGDRLPDYMVPPVLILVDAFPMTANQKVDRKALPAPERGVGREVAFVAPESELEQTIAGVWKDVLSLERVGVNDNFFEVGGSSLTAARVRSRLEKALGRSIPLVEIFKHPTIAALARSVAVAEPGEEPGTLAAAQSRTVGRREAVARLRSRRRAAQAGRRD